MPNSEYIQPHWPAPPQVKAYTTLKTGPGAGQFKENRELLKQAFALPSEPIWLEQKTHSAHAVEAKPENTDVIADASFTREPNRVCLVTTSDCLPILLCDRAGKQVAAIHAGWRGLGRGIIENTLKALDADHTQLLAWVGPAISQKHFEVGEEVRDFFLAHDQEAESAFIPSPQGRWLANLHQLAEQRLRKQGISAIYNCGLCTYSDAERFFSYRRDKAYLGTMVSLIWISLDCHASAGWHPERS